MILGNFLWTFGTSILVGFTISIPLGPSGLLCIRETLGGGLLRGLAVGMGSAFAEGLCALAANLGLQKLDVLRHWDIGLKLLGGILLLIIATKEFQKLGHYTPETLPETSTTSSPMVYLGLFSAGFLLIITNPLSVFAMAGLMGAFRMNCNTSLCTSVLGAGVFCGSLLWWSIVSIFVNTIKDQFSFQTLQYLRQWSVYLLFGLGVGVLLSVVLQDYFRLF